MSIRSTTSEEEDIPEISIELYLLDKLKARIQLARQIDNAQHKVKKENHEKNWLREAADAMEIEVDSDMGLRCVFALTLALSHFSFPNLLYELMGRFT